MTVTTTSDGTCCCDNINVCLMGTLIPTHLYLTVRTYNAGVLCAGPTNCPFGNGTLCQCFNLWAWFAANSLSLLGGGTGFPTTTWHVVQNSIAEAVGFCIFGFNGTATCTTVLGDLTAGSPVVANVNATTAGLVLGGDVSAAGIPAGSKITAIAPTTQITLDHNATATAAGVTINCVKWTWGGNLTSTTGVGFTFNVPGAMAQPTSTMSPFNMIFYSCFDSGTVPCGGSGSPYLGCYTMTP